jgi:PRC-barrel domain
MIHPLVPSDRVEAAAVYGRDGKKIGTIERLMVEKEAGAVAYAVVKCGGFLKGDIHHYPLPWNSLKYNVARKAYDTKQCLTRAPTWRIKPNVCPANASTLFTGCRLKAAAI